MPKYLVTEWRQFAERWLIEAEDEEQAQLRNGKIIDEADHGWHDSTLESIETVEVNDDRRHV